MEVCKRVRFIAIPFLILVLHAAAAFGADMRSGKFVTIEGQEISFFRVEGRDTIKGWLNGTAIDIPMETVSQIVFFDSPNSDYSMFGSEISAGEMEVTRRVDGQKFILQNAFLPSDCDCTYLTYSYRNIFTDELYQGNTALNGLRKIIFADQK